MTQSASRFEASVCAGAGQQPSNQPTAWYNDNDDDDVDGDGDSDDGDVGGGGDDNDYQGTVDDDFTWAAWLE